MVWGFAVSYLPADFTRVQVDSSEATPRGFDDCDPFNIQSAEAAPFTAITSGRAWVPRVPSSVATEGGV